MRSRSNVARGPLDVEEFVNVCATNIFNASWGEGQMNKQQDAREMLQAMLDRITDETNTLPVAHAKIGPTMAGDGKSRDGKCLDDLAERTRMALQRRRRVVASPVDDVFGILEQNTLQCVPNNHSKCVFEVSTILNLPLVGDNIHACLKAYSAKEKMDEKVECEECPLTLDNQVARVDTTRTDTILKWPQSLIIALKRFNQVENAQIKLLNRVDIPAILDPSAIDVLPMRVMFAYELQAVLNHHGDTMEAGHYTACVRQGSANQWWVCDDEVVAQCDSPTGPSADAYLLFYRKIAKKP